ITSGRACSSSCRASSNPATTRLRWPSSASSNWGCIARKGTCDVAIPATMSAMGNPSFSALFVHRRDIGAHVLARGHGIDQQQERVSAHVVEFPHLPAFYRCPFLRSQIIVLEDGLRLGLAALGKLSAAVDIP